jgi:DNA polymerase sigma
MKSRYEAIKKEMRSIRNSMQFSAKRIDELLQEVERISPTDKKPARKNVTMDELTQIKLQKLINQ